MANRVVKAPLIPPVPGPSICRKQMQGCASAKRGTKYLNMLLLQVAAMGRLALIADELGQASVATAVRGRMKAALAPWLAGANGDPLRHDGVWGGTCSAAGLKDGGELALFFPDLVYFFATGDRARHLCGVANVFATALDT